MKLTFIREGASFMQISTLFSRRYFPAISLFHNSHWTARRSNLAVIRIIEKVQVFEEQASLKRDVGGEGVVKVDGDTRNRKIEWWVRIPRIFDQKILYLEEGDLDFIFSSPKRLLLAEKRAITQELRQLKAENAEGSAAGGLGQNSCFSTKMFILSKLYRPLGRQQPRQQV